MSVYSVPVSFTISCEAGISILILQIKKQSQENVTFFEIRAQFWVCLVAKPAYFPLYLTILQNVSPVVDVPVQPQTEERME